VGVAFLIGGTGQIGRGAAQALARDGWTTGFNQLVLDPTDPFPEGYVLSDTWPGPDVQ
jgi:proline racemase